MPKMSDIDDEAETNGLQDPCPICLDKCSEKTFIKTCFHSFCFTCIIQWSEVTPTCPICKASFTAVIHDVKSFNDYKTFNIQPKEQSQQLSSFDIRRYQQSSVSSRRSRSMVQLRSKRKPACEERRKAVYLTGLRAQPFASSDKVQRIRNISCSFFKSNPASIHRLLPWITRDIKVLLGEDHVEFMLQLIISLVDKINLDSKEFADHLVPFLHQRTDHFMHELILFARSPLDLVAYDNGVSYGFANDTNDSRYQSITPVASGTVNTSEEVNDINQKIWFELHNDSAVMESTTIVISSTDSSSPETTPTNTHQHTDVTTLSEHIDESEPLGECSSNRKLGGKGKGPVNKRFKRKGEQHVHVDLTLSPNNSEQGTSEKFGAVHEHCVLEGRVHAVCDVPDKKSIKLRKCSLTENGNNVEQQATCAISRDEGIYSTDSKPTKLLHDASNIHLCSTDTLKAELVSVHKELKAAKQSLMNAELKNR